LTVPPLKRVAADVRRVRALEKGGIKPTNAPAPVGAEVTRLTLSPLPCPAKVKVSLVTSAATVRWQAHFVWECVGSPIEVSLLTGVLPKWMLVAAGSSRRDAVIIARRFNAVWLVT
jgi:hypothetical protein